MCANGGPGRPEENAATGDERFPPASVITGCLLGCLLPVIAYAEAMSALFGFGVIRRKWVWLLLIVPTCAWFGFVYAATPEVEMPLSERLLLTAMILGGQFAIAVIVSAVISRVGARARMR